MMPPARNSCDTLMAFRKPACQSHNFFLLFVLRIKATMSLQLLAFPPNPDWQAGHRLLQRTNLPVETQHLSEDQNQYHAHEDPRLLHVGPASLVTDTPNAVACCPARHAHSQPTSK